MFIRKFPGWKQLGSSTSRTRAFEKHWLYPLWGLVTAAASINYLILLAVAIPERIDFVRTPVWNAMSVLRALLLIAIGLWFAWRRPQRPVSTLDQTHQQFVVAIASIILVVTTIAIVLDPATRFTPWQSSSAWLLFILISIQIIWLAKRGMVQLGATLISLLTTMQLIANIGGNSVMAAQALPFLYVFVILCAGLLVRWWAGLVVALLLPIASAGVQTLGLAMGQPVWGYTLLLTAASGGIAGLVAVYAYSLARAQRQREQQQEELAAANTRLQLALEQAQEANQLKSQFVATISHELRTPLTTILGYTELLKEGDYGHLDDEQQEAIGRIHNSGNYLLQLINDVLNFSKIEAGKYTPTEETIDLAALKNELATSFAPLARSRGIALHMQLDPNVPMLLFGDRLGLQQILINLLGNALKFTEHGSVTLHIAALQQDKTLVCFQVADTGIGIAPTDQATIFEAFRQIDVSNTRSRAGTGLGLAITHRLVTLMRGEIGLESIPGQGSTFTVTLPLKLVS